MTLAPTLTPRIPFLVHPIDCKGGKDFQSRGASMSTLCYRQIPAHFAHSSPLLLTLSRAAYEETASFLAASSPRRVAESLRRGSCL